MSPFSRSLAGRLSLAIACTLLPSCQSEQAQHNVTRNVSISILHDNDIALAEWLNSAIAPFQKVAASAFPGNNIQLSLDQESTSFALDDIAIGRKKSDAVLLPHPGFAQIINSKVRNLGARVSQCRALIGSPYVAVLPKEQTQLLSSVLGRAIPDLSEAQISINLAELQQLFKNSLFGYSHPRRSARGQFSMLLSLAAVSPGFFDASDPWSGASKKLVDLQQYLEWYAPSDTQLLKRLSQRNQKGFSGSEGMFSLGLISARQLQTRKELKESLAVLMPSDRTIWELHSLCISEADWVSPLKKAILNKFQDFLGSSVMMESARERGFVPAAEGSTLTPPAIQFSTAKSELSVESVRSIEKPFAVALALDTSATMRSDSLAQIRDFAQRLLIDSPADNQVSLLRFSADVEVLGDRKTPRQLLLNKLANLRPGGGSSIYDTISKQYEILSRLPVAAHRRIALLITDGNDKNSERSVEDIASLVSEPERSNGFVSLHVLVVSPEQTDLAPLKKIIEAAGGTLYQSEPERAAELLGEIQESL